MPRSQTKRVSTGTSNMRQELIDARPQAKPCHTCQAGGWIAGATGVGSHSHLVCSLLPLCLVLLSAKTVSNVADRWSEDEACIDVRYRPIFRRTLYQDDAIIYLCLLLLRMTSWPSSSADMLSSQGRPIPESITSSDIPGTYLRIDQSPHFRDFDTTSQRRTRRSFAERV